MSAKELVQQALSSPKVAGVVSTVTTGTGLGTIFDWIPDDMGKLATLVGAILSLVLIRNHIKTGKKLDLQIRVLERREAERKKQVDDRRALGLDTLRAEDI